MSISKELKMKRPLESFRHEALLNIVRTASCLEKIAQSFFAQFDMTEAQYNILIVLKIEGRSLTQIELGERVVSSRPNVTVLLDRLEGKGYVERRRVENDRRIYQVHLTKKGSKAVDKAEKAYVEKVEMLMAVLNQSECQGISMALEKLRKSFQK